MPPRAAHDERPSVVSVAGGWRPGQGAVLAGAADAGAPRTASSCARASAELALVTGNNTWLLGRMMPFLRKSAQASAPKPACSDHFWSSAATWVPWSMASSWPYETFQPMVWTLPSRPASSIALVGDLGGDVHVLDELEVRVVGEQRRVRRVGVAGVERRVQRVGLVIDELGIRDGCLDGLAERLHAALAPEGRRIAAGDREDLEVLVVGLHPVEHDVGRLGALEVGIWVKLVSSLPLDETPTVNTGMPAAMAWLVSAGEGVRVGRLDRQAVDGVGVDERLDLGQLLRHIDARRAGRRGDDGAHRALGRIACAWGSVVSYPALYWSENSGMLGRLVREHVVDGSRRWPACPRCAAPA